MARLLKIEKDQILAPFRKPFCFVAKWEGPFDMNYARREYPVDKYLMEKDINRNRAQRSTKSTK